MTTDKTNQECHMSYEYGSKEFYAEQFADLIADVQHDSPEFSDNLVTGFLLALDDWRQYHVKQILELDRVEFKLNDQNSDHMTNTPDEI